MKKYLLVLVLFSVILAPALTARAATNEELQAQIQSLLKQLQALQGQTANQQKAFCYSFNQNLKFGDGGSDAESKGQDIRNLQTVLGKEGFQVDDSEQKGGFVFGESTAAAVVGFQEKYRDQILTPNRLSRGTGYVGPSTRIKLNKVYGCGNVLTSEPLPKAPTPTPQPLITIQPTTPQITVLTPNGGEQWTTGQSYKITWKAQALTGSVVDIYMAFPDGGVCFIGSAPASRETFTLALKENHPCQIPRTITTGNYRIALFANNVNPDGDWVAKDQSDGDITVVSPTVTQRPSITVLTPNGGEQLTPGQNYNITWNSTAISNVKIRLCQTSYRLGYICNEMPGSAGVSISAAQKSYIWYLDPNHAYFPNDKLEIKISSVDSSTSNISDRSNGTFSVR